MIDISIGDDKRVIEGVRVYAALKPDVNGTYKFAN